MIVRELAFELGLQDLVGPWIDLREKVAFLDQLSFGESDFGQLAIDLGLHGDGCQRRDSAECIDDDTNIAQHDGAAPTDCSPPCGKRPAAGGAELTQRTVW